MYQKYLSQGEVLFKERVQTLLDGDFESHAQDNASATYYSRSSIDYSSLALNFNSTALQLHNQIKTYSFRDFQLPVIDGKRISGSRITNVRCSQPCGVITQENAYTLNVSTADYVVIALIDRFVELIEAVEASDIELITEILSHNPRLINETTKEGQTPFALALRSGNDEATNAMWRHK